MAVTRTSLKNRFISVNNNFSSTLSSAIGIGSRDLLLVDTPSKLGNFGYITIDNNKGGEIIFFSKNLGNTLTTVIGPGGRGQDNTVARAAGGGSLVQQRVVAANVTQNQAAILSILQANHNNYIGPAGTDPNNDQFQLGNNGYTGYDKIGINSVIVKSTSAQYSIGRQIKKAFDKHYVNRMSGSGNVYGSSMSYNLSIANLQGSQPNSIEDYAATGDIRGGALGSLNLGATNSSIFNVPNKSSSAWHDEGVYFSSYISSIWRSSPTPLFIQCKDIIFTNKTMNPLGLLHNADGSISQTNLYGLQMNADASSLQNKIQLFNVRPSSIYQPYTVIATHHDSRIDSQLIRKDDDFFMSTYQLAGTQATTGGTLTVRRSIGSGVLGDRWALAYNNNLLINGNCFKPGLINYAATGFEIGNSGITLVTRDLRSVSARKMITQIYQTVIDKGWCWINKTAVGNVDGQLGGSDLQSNTYICLRQARGIPASIDFNNHISQFISYTQSDDKIGKFNLSFYGCKTQPGSGIPIDFGDVNGIVIMIVPIILDKSTNDYWFMANKRQLSYSNAKLTSISGIQGQLYSIPMDFDFSSVTGNICGFFINIGYNLLGPGASSNKNYLTQIKLQQGLQRTRFVQNKRQRITSKIRYESIRNVLNIQASSLSGGNLWITGKQWRDDASQTANVCFGKFIPYLTGGYDPYLTDYANQFYDQSNGSSAVTVNCFGARIKWTTDNGVTKLGNNPTYSAMLDRTNRNFQQTFGIQNAGSEIKLIHSSNLNYNLLPTNGVVIRTFNEWPGTTGHRGNILLSALGSTASKIILNANANISLSSAEDISLSNINTILNTGQIFINDSSIYFTQKNVSKDWRSVASSSRGDKLVARFYNVNRPLSQCIYTSTDYGATWTLRNVTGGGGNSNGECDSVACSLDGNIIFTKRIADYPYVSLDSGATWARKTGGPGLGTNDNLCCSWQGRTAVLTCVTGGVPDGWIYISNDTGNTWTRNANAGLRNWSSVACSSAAREIYASVYNGQIWSSVDDPHAIWNRFSSPTKSWRSIACSQDSSVVVAAESGGGIWLSTNYGINWSNIRPISSTWFRVSCSYDGTTIIAAEGSGSIFISKDTGATWTQVYPYRHSWSSLDCSKDGKKIIAGVYNDYIYTTVASHYDMTIDGMKYKIPLTVNE